MFNGRCLALGCVVAATLAACGGSSSSAKPSASGSPTSAQSDTGSSSTPPSGKTAPDALVAAKVMATADLTGVFAHSNSGVQDNGGLSFSEEQFSSQATFTTRDAKLLVTLMSSATATEAAQVYDQFVPRSTPPPVALVGVGDKAVEGGGTVVVLKGAQVLAIAAQPSDAIDRALNTAKANGTTDQAAIDAANTGPMRDAEKTARALAPSLSGDAATSRFTYLPTGALDPCGIDVAKLGSGDITVTNAPSFSDLPPMSECVYTFTGATPREPGTGRLALYTLTSAQGATAQPATTPAAQYATTLTGYGSQGGPNAGAAFGSATSGSISMAGKTTDEPDFTMLAQVPESGPGIVIRISSFRSSYVVDRDHCAEEIGRMFNELAHQDDDPAIRRILGNAAADAAEQKLEDDVRDWCLKQEQSAKPATGSHG